MWPEPLTAVTEPIASRTVAVTASAADGTPIARVLCAHGGPARCGIFGEMRIIDDGGAPRQRARALVLLVREALRYAESIGIAHVATELPPGASDAVRGFARRMSGRIEDNVGELRGELAAVRSHALDTTDADGNETT
jgi:hypothetical protein